MAGVDASKIQPDNPFKKNGGTAQMLQAAVSEIDPAQAARWRVGAGQGLAVATMAEAHSGGQLSERAMPYFTEVTHYVWVETLGLAMTFNLKLVLQISLRVLSQSAT